MRDVSAIRERYLKDTLSVRLGGLAANLSRVKSFAGHDGGREAVECLLEESKHFIEWTAAETSSELAFELVELQVQLARWQHNWERIWPNQEQRQGVVEQSIAWSKRVLEMSGLLTGMR